MQFILGGRPVPYMGPNAEWNVVERGGCPKRTGRAKTVYLLFKSCSRKVSSPRIELRFEIHAWC